MESDDPEVTDHIQQDYNEASAGQIAVEPTDGLTDVAAESTVVERHTVVAGPTVVDKHTVVAEPIVDERHKAVGGNL